jgi:hypothetical protein
MVQSPPVPSGQPASLLRSSKHELADARTVTFLQPRHN